MVIFYFLISIIVFLFIIEIITILFKLTGLSEDKARFQVISLITGSGFTTKEAELVTQHPTRRRLAQIVMVLGYLGFVTGISFLVDIFKNSLNWYNILIILSFFVILLFLIRNHYFMSFIHSSIEKIILKRFFKSKNPNHMYKLINRAKGYGVFNITLHENSKLNGVALMDSNLKPHNIIILNIDKGNQFIGFPKRDYVLEKGDNILIYGKVEEVIKAFELDIKGH